MSDELRFPDVPEPQELHGSIDNQEALLQWVCAPREKITEMLAKPPSLYVEHFLHGIIVSKEPPTIATPPVFSQWVDPEEKESQHMSDAFSPARVTELWTCECGEWANQLAHRIVYQLWMSGFIDYNHFTISSTAYDTKGAATEIVAHYVYEMLIHDRMNTPTSSLQHAASRLEAEEMIKDIPVWYSPEEMETPEE